MQATKSDQIIHLFLLLGIRIFNSEGELRDLKNIEKDLAEVYEVLSIEELDDCIEFTSAILYGEDED